MICICLRGPLTPSKRWRTFGRDAVAFERLIALGRRQRPHRVGLSHSSAGLALLARQLLEVFGSEVLADREMYERGLALAQWGRAK